MKAKCPQCGAPCTVEEIEGAFEMEEKYKYTKPQRHAVVVEDEHEAFEKWFSESHKWTVKRSKHTGNYLDNRMQEAWGSWQARAALQPAQPVQPSTNAIAQPVSVPVSITYQEAPDNVEDLYPLQAFARGWNACRAAMLSAAPKREGE